MLALAVAMGIGRFAFTPLLPMMQNDAGVTVADGGWLASANYLGYLLGALSSMVMRVRAATAIRGGLITIGLVTAGMGLEDDFAGWVVLRALAGVASAWVLIFASSWCLEKLAPLRRTMLNGVVFAGVGAGIMGAGMLCLALMYAKASSAQAWIVFGVLALVLSVVIWPTFGSDDDASSGADRRAAVATPSWDGESIRLVLCYGAFGFGYIIPATFLPAMARQAVHGASIFGWSWPIFGAAALASTLAAAVVPSFIGNRRLWIMSHLIMALGVALPVFWPGITGIMLAALCIGGTFMVTTMSGMQEAREVAGRNATGLIAAMTAAFAIGQIAGPVSASYAVGVNGSFSAALLVASLLLVVGAYGLSRRPGTAVSVHR